MTLATGDSLTKENFDEFISRLKHHHVGEGVEYHYTANPIFNVEARTRIYGISDEYTDNFAICATESVWTDPDEFVADMPDDVKKEFFDSQYDWCVADWDELSDYQKIEQVKDFVNDSDHFYVNDITVTGYIEKWEVVNSHLTKEGAEAFIKRKKHDYPDGLRIYVDSQYYSWEWNSIIEGLLSGKIAYLGEQYGCDWFCSFGCG